MYSRKVVLTFVLVMGLLLLTAPSNARAALWTSVPNPFACTSSGNACVAHTGFNTNARYWGQWSNARGNCTNYVAFRVSSNGGAYPKPTGNAITWADAVRRTSGAAAVNGTPAVGAVAWWGSRKGQDGHVGYVEQVSGNTIWVSDSVWNWGSRRYTATPGTANWPDAFLHIKDAPGASPPPATPGAGTGFYLRDANNGGSATHTIGYGRPGDFPIVGDWNGDGIDTPGVIRGGNQWLLRNSLNGGNADLNFIYGRPGDVPVIGDWDRNGTDTAGVVRGGNSWFLRNSNSGGSADVSFIFGRPGDAPIAGDWNGDGVDTPGIIRGGNQWFLRNSQSGGSGDIGFIYGRPGDMPVVGDWDGDGASSGQ